VGGEVPPAGDPREPQSVRTCRMASAALEMEGSCGREGSVRPLGAEGGSQLMVSKEMKISDPLLPGAGRHQQLEGAPQEPSLPAPAVRRPGGHRATE